MGVGATAQATVHREVFFNWAASSRRQPSMLGCLRPAERKADDDFRKRPVMEMGVWWRSENAPYYEHEKIREPEMAR